jgi:hypothetical protein
VTVETFDEARTIWQLTPIGWSKRARSWQPLRDNERQPPQSAHEVINDTEHVDAPVTEACSGGLKGLADAAPRIGDERSDIRVTPNCLPAETRGSDHVSNVGKTGLSGMIELQCLWTTCPPS